MRIEAEKNTPKYLYFSFQNIATVGIKAKAAKAD
jgi:hypothetical protein